MSIELMSHAFKLPFAPNDKLIILSLCDFAHDDGKSCYPSIKKIALKSSVSERTVQRALARFKKIGLIAAIKNQKGGGRNTTHFQINTEMLKSGDILSPLTKKTKENKGVEVGKGDISSPLKTNEENKEDSSQKNEENKDLGVTNDTFRGDKACHPNHHITIKEKKEVSSSNLSYVECAKDFCDDGLPPPPLKNDFCDDIVFSEQIENMHMQQEEQSVEEEEEEEEEISSSSLPATIPANKENHSLNAPSVRDIAFTIITEHDRLNAELFGKNIPTIPPLLKDVEMVEEWVQEGVTLDFCGRFMESRMRERRMKGHSGGFVLRYWDADDFLVQAWRKEEQAKSEKAAKKQTTSCPALAIKAGSFSPDTAIINFTSPCLRKHLDDTSILPSAWGAWGREQLNALAGHATWQAVKQHMKERYGDAVMAHWIERCHPLLICENNVVLWCESRFTQAHISSTYLSDLLYYFCQVIGKEVVVELSL